MGGQAIGPAARWHLSDGQYGGQTQIEGPVDGGTAVKVEGPGQDKHGHRTPAQTALSDTGTGAPAPPARVNPARMNVVHGP
ncbi:hypothetical protein GCM10023166_20890 [Paeniglutamicibacter cryotolerans]